MILCAGLGTRLLPFTDLRPKPALPIRGIPVLTHLLHLLKHHGVEEVILNLHHLPELIERAVERYRPPGLRVRFSREEGLLGTGGGIRRVAEFLRESDPSLVLAGDMLLDVDLGRLVARHRDGRDQASLVLRRDPRAATFGTIGFEKEGRVRRIGRRFDRGGESDEGVFVGLRLFSPDCFDALPARDAFEDLSDWLAPESLREDRIGALCLEPEDCLWEPVGTPAEYLRANLEPAKLSYFDADALARSEGTKLLPELVVGAGATLGDGVRLERSVVWDGESVPAGLERRDGIFAGGRFHVCAVPSGSDGAAR